MTIYGYARVSFRHQTFPRDNVGLHESVKCDPDYKDCAIEV